MAKTIDREASDKSKGFTLQKLRATSLMLSQLKKGVSGSFVAAVEYHGDIYLEDTAKIYVEENKAYASKDFSFVSPEVKNTLVYFLDFWLNNNRQPTIQFAFYTTNSVTKEINKGQVKTMSITLPEKPILELLINKDYTKQELMPAVQKLILIKYHEQYAGNAQYKLEESHYTTIEKFKNEDWIEFLNMIEWKFNQPDIDELETTLIDQIANIDFPGINIKGKEPFIRAALFYDLELRQTKTKLEDRLIKPTDIELIYRRAATGNIDEGSYKYLNFDYTETRQKTKQAIERFISDKYSVITGHGNAPYVLNRKVALFDQSLKLKGKQTENQTESKNYKVEGLFSGFVNTEKPIFLFGELGSGKSTIVANYLLSIIDRDSEIVPIFIPSSYLHEKEFSDIESLSLLISRYVNQELMLTDKFFDFSLLFKTGKEVILIIDGVDELDTNRSKSLIRLLKKLKENYSQLRVIATGRPLELEGLIPNGWHTLVTIPLTQAETKTLLQKEISAGGLSDNEAQTQAEKKMILLKSRPELLAIATTPLVVCSITNDLDEALKQKSLGDILYDVILKHLDWHEKDTKQIELTAFLKQFPNKYQREILLADLAFEIFQSPSKALTEEKILQVLGAHIAQSPEKNEIVNQARIFFTSVFLQKTTDGKYGFISAAILECSVALKIAELLKISSESEKYDFKQWRVLSFAMAICRRKDYTEQIRNNIATICRREMQWPDKNVAPFAIIVAELRDGQLAYTLINGLKLLAYRPLRLMKQKDHLSLYSFSYSINLAEDEGFEWFFNEYLDNKTPLIHYEAEMAKDILAYYLIINDFKLSTSRLRRLQELIQPNISFATQLCYQMLPCLSLIAPAELAIDLQCRLLVDLLKDDILSTQSEQALTKLAAKDPGPVLNALEILSQKTWSKEDPNSVLLWLKLNKTRALSKQVLDTAIETTTKENYKTILSALCQHIKKENLIAYLRLCIIGQTKLAGSVALLLYWENENDFELLSDGLINSIDWLSQQYDMVDEIAAYVAQGKEKAVEVLGRKMPHDNHLGIPPSYWRIFLDALLSTDEIYVDTFINALEDLRAFVLTRYPDVRIRLHRLLTEKPMYMKAIRQAAAGLETGLRNNANSVLITCFPDQEADALTSIVSGFYKHASSEEWHAFCLGLNYSAEVLNTLYGAKSKLVEGAKTYALLLLFHNQFALNENDLNDLVQGLLGPGYFFDRASLPNDITTQSILSGPEFLSKLTPYLTGTDKERANRAASLLLEYHTPALTTKQLATAWNLTTEDFEDSFFRFSLENEQLLLNEDFVKHVLNDTAQGSPPSILSLFFQAQKDPANWKELLLRFVKRASRFHADSLYHLNQWLISFTRRNPQHKTAIIDALKELLLIPGYKESVAHNSIYLFLLLMADDFECGSKEEMQNLLSRRGAYHDEELLLALALRSSFNIPGKYLSPSSVSHITLFSNYEPKFIQSVPIEELGRLLVDPENLSIELFYKIEQIILFGQLGDEELLNLSSKGDLGAYFVLLVGYCRSKAIDVAQLFKIREIGGYKVYQQQQKGGHLSIIWKLYHILLRKDEYRKHYFDALELELENPNAERFHEAFHELLIAKRKVEFRHFERLLNELLDSPFYLREHCNR